MPFIFNYADVSPKELQQIVLYSLPAVAKHHVLSFKGFSRKWGSSIATLSKERDARTNGSIILVASKDLPTVDRFYPLYKREKISIEIPITGDMFWAQTYILDAALPESRPSREYLNSITKHLKMFWSGDLNPDDLYIPPPPPSLSIPTSPRIEEVSIISSEIPIPSTSIKNSVKVETVEKETSPPRRKRGRPRKDAKK